MKTNLFNVGETHGHLLYKYLGEDKAEDSSEDIGV